VNEHRNKRVEQNRIHLCNLPQTRIPRNQTSSGERPHAFQPYRWWKAVVLTYEGPAIPATTDEPTDNERRPVQAARGEVKKPMQTVTIRPGIPNKATELHTADISNLGPGVKSVSILRNGQIDVVIRDDSVERWSVTNLLRHTSYTVTRHGDSYGLSLASRDGFIVADVEEEADIPEVADRLAQLATLS